MFCSTRRRASLSSRERNPQSALSIPGRGFCAVPPAHCRGGTLSVPRGRTATALQAVLPAAAWAGVNCWG